MHFPTNQSLGTSHFYPVRLIAKISPSTTSGNFHPSARNRAPIILSEPMPCACPLQHTSAARAFPLPDRSAGDAKDGR